MTVRLETVRLVLRPWRVDEAAVQRQLWAERDERVPARRRIDAEGRPTLAEFEEGLREADAPATTGLLAVERKAEGDVIGYCGLNAPEEPGDPPELAYELLRRTWGHGYATEAAHAVLDWARASGFEALRAGVWDWNTGSRRVLAKLGFVESGREDTGSPHGVSLITTLSLRDGHAGSMGS